MAFEIYNIYRNNSQDDAIDCGNFEDTRIIALSGVNCKTNKYFFVALTLVDKLFYNEHHNNEGEIVISCQDNYFLIEIIYFEENPYEEESNFLIDPELSKLEYITKYLHDNINILNSVQININQKSNKFKYYLYDITEIQWLVITGMITVEL